MTAFTNTCYVTLDKYCTHLSLYKNIIYSFLWPKFDIYIMQSRIFTVGISIASIRVALSTLYETAYIFRKFSSFTTKDVCYDVKSFFIIWQFWVFVSEILMNSDCHYAITCKSMLEKTEQIPLYIQFYI